jgi:dUTP pyrophosphatase
MTRAAPSPVAPEVLVQRLPHGQGLELPAYQTPLAAGLDLRAAVADELVLAPGARAAVPTGLCLAIPAGFEGQVRPRSGLALRLGLAVLNAPGTVDADYRGEVQVILVNLGQESVRLKRGERIAQLVIAPVVQASLREVPALPATERGEGGFGHTGR